MKNSFKIDILYFIEEDEIVLDSPQLDIIAVEKVANFDNQDMNQIALSLFTKTLKKRIDRYDQKQDFIDLLISCDILSKLPDGNLETKNLDYFLAKYEHKRDFMKNKGVRQLKHEVTI